MCGMVGYLGEKNTKEILLDGLKELEYRGYDSAGIAVLEDGHLYGFDLDHKPYIKHYDSNYVYNIKAEKN